MSTFYLGDRLSDAELRVLRAIDEYHHKTGYPPSLRELARIMNHRTPSSALRYVRRLMEQQLVCIARGGPRHQMVAHTMTITKEGRQVLKLLARSGRAHRRQR